MAFLPEPQITCVTAPAIECNSSGMSYFAVGSRCGPDERNERYGKVASAIINAEKPLHFEAYNPVPRL